MNCSRCRWQRFCTLTAPSRNAAVGNRGYNYLARCWTNILPGARDPRTCRRSRVRQSDGLVPRQAGYEPRSVRRLSGKIYQQSRNSGIVGGTASVPSPL